jgi:DmsE family decaheme c-type cytochrome
MNIFKKLPFLLTLIGAVVFSVSSPAAEVAMPDAPKATSETSAATATQEPDKQVQKDLVLKGDATCTACHDEADAPELLYIGKTMHGTGADARTPTCTKCHGESRDHVLNSAHTNVRPKPDRIFSGQLAPGSVPSANRVNRYFGLQGKLTTTPVEERNAACLECHARDARRSHWEGSAHQARDVACTSCHRIHVAKDPILDRRTQAELCYACHKEQRAQVNKPSHHPVPEGKMGCSDCHNPHGSAGPKLMKRDSINETCYTCHMEKRGPFAHNHEPVDDDCTNCHNPHGTTAESMLKMRPPFLCSGCHTPHGALQPSLSASGGTSFYGGAAVTQGGACVNCHSEIHGSNNPGPNAQFLFR